MIEFLKTIGGILIGSGIVAWVVTILAVVLTIQKRLSIHITPKKKNEEFICPSCERIWDLKTHDACRCGAVLEEKKK